jgi:hypothetical protein
MKVVPRVFIGRPFRAGSCDRPRPVALPQAGMKRAFGAEEGGFGGERISVNATD